MANPNSPMSGQSRLLDLIATAAGVAKIKLAVGSKTITGATSGYWLATMALQRTAYAPPDVITTTAGHEVANFDPAGNPWNDSWHYVAWNYAADVKGTIAVNPYLNKWGRAALGITIPAAVS